MHTPRRRHLALSRVSKFTRNAVGEERWNYTVVPEKAGCGRGCGTTVLDLDLRSKRVQSSAPPRVWPNLTALTVLLVEVMMAMLTPLSALLLCAAG